MSSAFIHIYDFFEKRKTALLTILVILFVAFGYLASRIDFEEDITRIFDFDKDTRQYKSVVQSTRLVDKLILILSITDTSLVDQEKLMFFADSLCEKLSEESTGLIKKINLKFEEDNFLPAYSVFMQNIPVFLEADDYKNIDSLFSQERLTQVFKRHQENLASPMGTVYKYNIQNDPAGLTAHFMKRLLQFQTSASLLSNNGYLFSIDGKNLVFYIEPSNPPNETNQNGKLIDYIDESGRQLQDRQDFGNVSYHILGASAMSVANARQLQRDIFLTLSLAGLALILLLVTVFKKRRVPVLILITVLFAGGFSLAVISIIKTSVSLIAVGACSVILGIVVNYPIHLFSHKLYEPNMRNVIRDMVMPLTIGSITTIVGFFLLLFMKAQLLHDLGLFGAFSLIGASVFTLVFLPHLYGNKAKEKLKTENSWIEKLSEISFEKKRFPLALIVIVTPVLFYFAPKVKFDSDLNNLNYISKSIKEGEAIMNRINGGSKQSVYTISFGETREQALTYSFGIKKLTDSLNTSDLQLTYSGITNFLPPFEEQKLRVEKWNAYWTSPRKSEVIKNINVVSAGLGFNKGAFSEFQQQIENSAHPLSDSDYDFLINTFASDFISHTDSMVTLVAQLKFSKGKDETVRNALMKMPGTIIIDWRSMTNKLLALINSDFNLLFLLTATLVFCALLITYGRIELALVSFIPMAISWIWILGLMALLNLKFNFVNIILSTFIFGLGDDFCIFIMDGLQQQYKTGKKHLTSVKSGIYLSAITAITGLGVLIFAKHPAMRSMAFVSILGIISVLVISLTLEPFLFNLFITKPRKKGLPPITLLVFLKSVVAFSYFTFGSFLLSFISLILYPAKFLAPATSKYLYHWLIQRFSQSILKLMVIFHKVGFNREMHSFSIPSIIICNHQSVIDILLLISINPKIILLTNKWVWNSPVFGIVVRSAGYLTVANGIEPGIEKLRKTFNEGYSIAVFPEGTRSLDGKLQRFHKGAFYLSNELSADIIPVIIHGANRCIKKGSMVVNNEVITLKFLNRIKASDLSFGTTYQERAKNITRYYKNEFNFLSQELETTAFYRNQLISGYLFKGPVLEWYLKIKIRLEDNYKLFSELVPVSGTIVDAGCGYGFMTNLLSFVSPNRKITGIDYDEEKITVASNCYYKSNMVNFEAANLVKYRFSDTDCFIISDVLHYLTKNDRDTFLKNCINHLRPGGSIIIRDADKSIPKRHRRSKFTEILSTKIVGFNKTLNNLEYFSRQEIFDLANLFGLTTKVIDNTRVTSNVIYVLKKENETL